VARLTLGSAQFGMAYGVKNIRGQVPAAEVAQILRTAWDAGIRCVDTSADYGESESTLGRAFRESGCALDVVTKCPIDSSPTDSLRTSLRRLQRSRVAGYLFHDIQTYRRNPDLWKDMEDARAQGLAERVGFSLYLPQDVEFLMERSIKFDIVQFPYNLFDRRFEPFFSILRVRGVQVHVRSVFLQGLLLMEPSDVPAYFSSARTSIARIHSIAKAYGLTPNALCMAFSSAPPEVDSIVIGVDGVANLRSNTAAFADSPRAKSALTELGSVEIADESVILPYRWPRREDIARIKN
jgi:aryl-alcohol dehydrogenase-like predicted oxidoreductase